MQMEPLNRLDGKALFVWRWSGALTTLISLAIVVALIVLTIRFDWPVWISVAAGLLTALEGLLVILLVPRLRLNRWRYEIREQEIDLLRGIVVRKRTVIPMVRVQHVDTQQGPLMRKYGLSSVTFSTAAGQHEIPALANEEADRVRIQIAELARVNDEDV
ncbi:PH domain-containing protein [Paenibacillus sp. MBLB4367]|uniref:PH domain-containing protein n=1 Tax=Paenibacillus sp. MBLB4367 TaxID=3384767 RepID=UPI0039080FE0